LVHDLRSENVLPPKASLNKKSSHQGKKEKKQNLHDKKPSGLVIMNIPIKYFSNEQTPRYEGQKNKTTPNNQL
jgi:hypothetical protein